MQKTSRRNFLKFAGVGGAIAATAGGTTLRRPHRADRHPCDRRRARRAAPELRVVRSRRLHRSSAEDGHADAHRARGASRRSKRDRSSRTLADGPGHRCSRGERADPGARQHRRSFTAPSWRTVRGGDHDRPQRRARLDEIRRKPDKARPPAVIVSIPRWPGPLKPVRPSR